MNNRIFLKDKMYVKRYNLCIFLSELVTDAFILLQSLRALSGSVASCPRHGASQRDVTLTPHDKHKGRKMLGYTTLTHTYLCTDLCLISKKCICMC